MVFWEAGRGGKGGGGRRKGRGMRILKKVEWRNEEGGEMNGLFAGREIDGGVGRGREGRR